MMNHKKKVFSLLLIFVMVFMFAACGDDTADYPVMEEVTLGNAETATGNGFSAQYDADKWVYDSTLGFAIYDKEVYESGNPEGKCANVNAIVSQAYDGPFTEKDMDTIVEQAGSLGIDGYEIGLKEMRMFKEEPVIYFESSITLTDDLLDLMIEQGALTEADIEALGGREAVIDGGSQTQMSVSAIIDGKIVIFTGTYNNETEKSAVLEAILGMIQTGKAS